MKKLLSATLIPLIGVLVFLFFVSAGTLYLNNNLVSISATGSIDIPAGQTYQVGGVPVTMSGLPYGSYYDTTDQTTPLATKSYAVTFNVTDAESGMSLAANDSVFTMTHAGKYLITFSAVMMPSAPSKTYEIFLKKGGVNYACSNTIWKSIGTNQARIVTVTYIVTFAAGDTWQLQWWSDDGSSKMDYTTATKTNPTRPLCPSIILTCNLVSL